MGFQGIGDVLIEHGQGSGGLDVLYPDLEARFWTEDASNLPDQEAESLRTSLDDPDGDSTQEVQLLTSAGTDFTLDGYGRINFNEDVDSDFTFKSSSAPSTNANLSSPADLWWMEIVDVSYAAGENRIAFGRASSATTIASGQRLRIKAGTDFHIGAPSSDDVDPSFASPNTYTRVNAGMAKLLRDVIDGSDIDANFNFDTLRARLLFGDGTQPASNPQDAVLTGFSGTDVSVTQSEGRFSFDFTNHTALAPDGFAFDITDSEAPWSVEYVQLELVDTGADPTIHPFAVKKYSSPFPQSDYATAFLLKSIDLIM